MKYHNGKQRILNYNNNIKIFNKKKLFVMMQ